MRIPWLEIALLLLVALPAAAVAHPSLYETPQSIQRAKDNIRRHPWAQKLFDQIRADADLWAAKSEPELRAIFPAKDAIYAYGFAGCPVCKAGWSTWGSIQMCDFARPGVVKCPKCARSFPDAEHPDSGRGWIDPATGKKHYFVGVYNAFVAQQTTLLIVNHLADAYALTGEPKYARAAAILLDQMAAIYPASTIGSIDYPGADGPAGEGGRFERPQYQVARVLVFLARYYDLLSPSPELDQPSAVPNAGTIRANIEENLLKDGAEYCWKMGFDCHMGLTNGQADYIRGLITVGQVLGIERYMDFALDGPTSITRFLDNCLDRDGLYYETSQLYSEHAVSLYVDMAEMLANYRSKKHPQGVNLFQHPKLRRAMVDALLGMYCAGHLGSFGDTSPDTTQIDNPRWAPKSGEAYFFAEHLYADAQGDEAKQLWKTMERLCDGDVEARRAETKGVQARWLLFNAREPLTARTAPEPLAAKSSLLGGKGIAILRSGEGPDSRAVLLRYGPALNHAHFDDLNVNLFALGRDLSYDLGYSLGSAHVQVGLSKQTAAHNLVVIDETSQMKDGLTGGSAEFFAAVPGLQVVEAGSPASYSSQKVTEYHRTLALVDIAPDKFYLLDLFHVTGGSKQDQFWHFAGKLEEPEGVQINPTETKGSLAGPQYDWGARIGPDGDVIGKDAGGPYWNPPPGNAYGFFHDLRRGPAKDALRLSWKQKDGARVRATLLPRDAELVTATAPGILPTLPSADYAILRATPGASPFAAVIEPTRGETAIESVTRLDQRPLNPLGSVGVCVSLLSGRKDYLFSTRDRDGQAREIHDTRDSLAFEFAGQFAMLSADSGQIRRAFLIGRSLVASEKSETRLSIRVAAPDYTGALEKIENGKLYTAAALPANMPAGQILFLNRPGYTHSSPYTIAGVRKTGDQTEIDLGGASLLLGRGIIGEKIPSQPNTFQCPVPLEQATSVAWKESGYFTGKRIVNERTGKASIVTRVGIRRDSQIAIRDADLLAPGDPFAIYDLQPGDTLTLPAQIDLRAEGDKYRLTTNASVEITLGKFTKHFEPGEWVFEPK